MPISLAEAKVGMADKVDQQVVDEFRRASLLLDMADWSSIFPLAASFAFRGKCLCQTIRV